MEVSMPDPSEASAERLSPWWRHATILVMIAGFTVLSIVTALTYTNAPPIPGRVVVGVVPILVATVGSLARRDAPRSVEAAQA
jgi:nitric oxide reductase large subunit